MKKIKILTSMLLLGCVFSAYAQETKTKSKTMVDILRSVDWEDTGFYDHSPLRGITTYKETTTTSYIVPKDKQCDITRGDERRYYFSEEWEIVFNEDKVGKATEGKYLILEVINDLQRTIAYEVITISEKELIIKYLATGHMIGGPPTHRYIPAEKDWCEGRSVISRKESLRRSLERSRPFIPE